MRSGLFLSVRRNSLFGLCQTPDFLFWQFYFLFDFVILKFFEFLNYLFVAIGWDERRLGFNFLVVYLRTIFLKTLFFLHHNYLSWAPENFSFEFDMYRIFDLKKIALTILKHEARRIPSGYSEWKRKLILAFLDIVWLCLLPLFIDLQRWSELE